MTKASIVNWLSISQDRKASIVAFMCSALLSRLGWASAVTAYLTIDVEFLFERTGMLPPSLLSISFLFFFGLLVIVITAQLSRHAMLRCGWSAVSSFEVVHFSAFITRQALHQLPRLSHDFDKLPEEVQFKLITLAYAKGWASWKDVANIFNSYGCAGTVVEAWMIGQAIGSRAAPEEWAGIASPDIASRARSEAHFVVLGESVLVPNDAPARRRI
jgi:hypothetical protein